MDLDLLHRTLDDLGQPGFRALQVWEWVARGVGGYEEMTNVPATLRSELPGRVPFSTLSVVDQAE
jgi:23S rRNA (adenine2503-C2)-methyltransferase